MLQYSPKIVTDSLVMCLDASNNKSYPTDLPVKNGLALWLDAADDSTFSYSSGTSVSQWRDKSGSNFHASQATVGSQPSRSTFQNSRKTVNFDGTNDTVTIPSFVSNSEMSIFVVSNCGTSLFIEHSTDVNSLDGFYIAGMGTAMIAIRRGAIISYIFNTNWLSGGYSIASGVNSTGLDLLTYKNGTQQTLTSDNRYALTNSYTTANLYIGSRAASSTWSTGPIAEIIIYNRKVTTAERNSIHTYLGQKWGISNTDRSIVDLSNNNNHGLLGNGTVANMPDYNYYNKSLTYNKGQSDTLVVTNSTSLKNNNTTIELYMKFNSAIASNTGDYIQFGVGSGNYGQYYFRNESPNLAWNWYPASSASSNLPYAISNFSTDTYYLITLTGDSAGASKMYVNGIQVASSAGAISAVTTWTSNNLTIGGYFWDGYSNSDIALTRIYSRVLSAAEISQNYEAIKSRFANTIVQQGLMLHLDAENPSSYAGAGTVWYDVSGNGYNAGMNNITPSNWVTYNGVKAFETNDTNNQNFTVGSFPFPQSGRTYEIWINSKSFSLGWQTWFDDGGGERVLFGTSTNTMYVYPSVEVSANLVAGQWYQLLYTMVGGSGTAVVVYKDGQAIGSGTYGYVINSGTGTLFILGDGGSEITSCYCSTVRVYNRVLSAAEVLQNYNATKGKFGL